MVCRTCWGPAGVGFARCYQCELALGEAGELLADVVAPIRYAVRGGELATDLRRYKSERCDAAEAAHAAGRLRELLAGFLTGHGREVWRAAAMPAVPSAVAVVPSGQGRAGVHPLSALVRGCLELPLVRERLALPLARECLGLPLVRMAVQPGEVHTRGVNHRWIQVHDRVAGSDILVVDDTWVSGGSAQSTAAALKRAGARRVAIVVFGRHVNPDDPRSAPLLKAARGDLPPWCPPGPSPFVLKAGQ